MGQGDQPRGNVLLRELSDLSTLDRSQEILDRLEILLTDYLVCVAHASQANSSTRSSLSEDGVLGLGAWLALQSTQSDRDDIDWTIGTHPGSVIWSTLFALGLIHEKTRTNFMEAALAGFRSSASIGNFLGVAHRAKWHVTATAGTFAAASAASVSLGHSSAVHQRALQLAGANMGGSALAPRERNGASAFNRSAATTLGTMAAMAAISGAAAVENIWDGAFGVLELFNASDFPLDANLAVNGVPTTALRLFPIAGFAQSAVLATTLLAQRNFDHLEDLVIGLSQDTIGWLDGSRGGFWWDVRAAVSAAWASKDPTDLYPNDEYLDRVRISTAQLPFGAASISIRTSTGQDSETIYSPPGIDFQDPQEGYWRNFKWSTMVGNRLSEIEALSDSLISGESGPELWNRVKELLRN
ncbi:MAG: MmgE/PrpD family protein [Actinobacteria bacterium]|nr:MmgE/PrpD family protein [Actinomycetota bacterium]